MTKQTRDNYYLREMWAGRGGMKCHACNSMTWMVWLDANESGRLEEWLATAKCPVRRERGIYELKLGIPLCSDHAVEFCEQLNIDRPRSISDLATQLKETR